MAGAWTPERRAAQAETLRKAREAKSKKAEEPKGSFAKIVAVDQVAPDDLKRLLAEMADLKAQLAHEKSERTREQQDALELAQSQGVLMQTGIEEIPTGRKVSIEKCVRYKRVGFEKGRPVHEPVFEEVEVPTYYYKIDMPPCGGWDLKTNGMPIYQGSTVEVDVDTLRDLKDRIYRLWAHDASLHGNDENAYRHKKNPSFSMRGRA